jgi:hypothetical protein
MFSGKTSKANSIGILEVHFWKEKVIGYLIRCAIISFEIIFIGNSFLISI